MGDLEDALLLADAFLLVDQTDAIAVEVGKLCLGEWARLSAVVLSTVLEPDLYAHANTSGQLAGGLETRRRHDSESIGSRHSVEGIPGPPSR